MKMRAIGLWAAGAVALVIALATGVLMHDDSLGRIASRGVLRIGYAVEAPYAMLGADGKVLGESPITAGLIAARLGVKRIEWVQVPFPSLIPGLLERRYDLIAAGMFITPERAALVSFARPTLRVASGLLVRRGNPRGVTSYATLAVRRDLRVAVLSGAVEGERLRQNGVMPHSLLVLPDSQSAVAAVGNGTADALALSLPSTRWIAMTHGNRFESVAGVMGQPYDLVAVAVRPEDKALLKAWNEAADAVVGSPEHLAAIHPFGFTADDLPAAADLARR